MTILLLGGTADARHLADRLLKKSVKVIYSVAGLVRTPDMTCEVLVGGFSALGGLAYYVDEKNISMIVDVTHPYAKKITQTAMSVAEEKNIAYVRFHRPAWLPKVGDNWHEVSESCPFILDRVALAMILIANMVDNVGLATTRV